MSEEYQSKSAFHQYREQYQPQMPKVFQAHNITFKAQPVPVKEDIKTIFPALCKGEVNAFTCQEDHNAPEGEPTLLRIGCVLSGGQAAGGHNVIVGIFEQIKKRNPNSQLFGFLNGPMGIIKGNYVEIRQEMISYFKNRGGFDMIRSGRDKIEKPEEFESSMKNCQFLKLDGLVVIGGDDSNTNACLLAEYFQKNGCATKVVGCPKTIDGDLKNDFIEVSFGFDTACKTYSELIGNLMIDTISTKKYYHFVRLMGRSASHIVLECSLLTRPNYAFIGEEVESKKTKLSDLVDDLIQIIIERSKKGQDYGVVLVPEGLIEFIDEIKVLISEINEIYSRKELKNEFTGLETSQLFDKVCSYLTPASIQVLRYIPRLISEQLLLDRDSHGNVQVAKVETEQLLIDICQNELEMYKQKGEYNGKFQPVSHYFGYEGRCAFPSNFDCDYCYSLGVNAAVLIEKGFTGVMSCIQNLSYSPDQWIPSAVPLVTMMHSEMRHGAMKPVIAKALTDLNGSLFQMYAAERDQWAIVDHYACNGPIQFEVECPPPFLVKPPNYESLYNMFQKTYDPKNSPFFELDPRYHTSNLGLQRLSKPVQLPRILQDDQYVVAKTPGVLTYASEDLKTQIEKSMRALATYSDGSHLIEVQRPQNIHSDQVVLPKRQKLRIAISFNGRQAPGGHNIIDGLLRFCKRTQSQLLGFRNGTSGIFKGDVIEITEDNFEFYLNTGGFHFLGRSSDKMRDPDELKKAKETCEKLQLDGLVLVGASHTLSDALLLSNYLLEQQVNTRVIAVPCTIAKNIGHHMLEATLGFDSATKVYSQLIGNLAIDSASAVKYFYFIRLMGRYPSHVVLECALQTKPNIVLISEEIVNKGWTINDVVKYIADIVAMRSSNKKNFGTVLIPEGLLAYFSEFRQLMEELNAFFLKQSKSEITLQSLKLMNDPEFVKKILSPWCAARFLTLPDFIKKQFVGERESSGDIQLSKIETARLLAYLVDIELKNRKAMGQFNGSFQPICHYLGYQGRCAIPSIFDSNLGTTYGFLAGALIQSNVTGYCTTARGLNSNVLDWHPGAIPLLNMASLKQKRAHGEGIPIISTCPVNLFGGPFLQLKNEQESWKINDYCYCPGPTQFYGEKADDKNMTLKYEYENYQKMLKEIEQLTQRINRECRFGTHEDLLLIAIDHLGNLKRTVQTIKHKFN